MTFGFFGDIETAAAVTRDAFQTLPLDGNKRR